MSDFSIRKLPDGNFEVIPDVDHSSKVTTLFSQEAFDSLTEEYK